MKRNTKIAIGILTAVLIIVIIQVVLPFLYVASFNPATGVYVYFDKDATAKTLTVKGIDSQGETLYWSKVTIRQGNATLPTGTIKVGDIVINCKGWVDLVYDINGPKAMTIVVEDFT
jgi:hypothetical protein